MIFSSKWFDFFEFRGDVAAAETDRYTDMTDERVILNDHFSAKSNEEVSSSFF